MLWWYITDKWNVAVCTVIKNTTKKNSDPDEKMVEYIVEQFKELLLKVGQGKIRGQITITGGEPFIREDFFSLLGIARKKNKQYFDVAILTNGTLINTEIAKRLKELQPIFVHKPVWKVWKILTY